MPDNSIQLMVRHRPRLYFSQMRLGLVAFMGLGWSLLCVCLTQITKMDPVSRLCITLYLTTQTACCFFVFTMSILGRRGCEWVFDRMEMSLNRI